MMVKFKKLILSAAFAVALVTSSQAAGFKGLFDTEGRAVLLRTAAYAMIRNACLRIPASPKWANLPPIMGLAATEGYGSDNSAEDFSWAVMVLTGRALAGDKSSSKSLKDLLSRWASANAFSQTEEVYDAYYALKRQLLPLAVAYQVLLPSLSGDEATKLKLWIDPLVRRIDKIFNGDVDRNNHRILADSVLALWGAINDDRPLLDAGLSRYATVLSETRVDGTLQLEARRGSRALWYQRQTLSSLVVIAETARGAGIDLYSERAEGGRAMPTLVGALMNGLSSPVLVSVYAAENHIPGPEKDFLKLDLGFLETRGHGRHYMAWSEAASHAGEDLSYQRLRGLFDHDLTKQRPLIDEFAGGNATCFWGQP